MFENLIILYSDFSCTLWYIHMFVSLLYLHSDFEIFENYVSDIQTCTLNIINKVFMYCIFAFYVNILT